MSLSLFQSVLAQTELPKNQLKDFLNELKIEILNDTSKFDRADLFHNSIGTHNRKSYSKLYIINRKYGYKLDIVPGKLVKEFADEFLISKKVKSILLVEKSPSLAIYGMYGEHGSILIELRKGFNPEVAGLKLNSIGGNNFTQRKSGELLIRENTPQSTQIKSRTISGVILSDRNEPIPGVTITEIGKYDHGTTSDINGKFSLTVENKSFVYIDLSGMHFERYVKYESGMDFKKIIFKHKGSKKADRLSEKVYQEWKKTTHSKR